MGLEEPTDNIGTVLTKGAIKLGKVQRQRDRDGKCLLYEYHMLPDMKYYSPNILGIFENILMFC
jgi:hypothetical protein